MARWACSSLDNSHQLDYMEDTFLISLTVLYYAVYFGLSVFATVKVVKGYDGPLNLRVILGILVWILPIVGAIGVLLFIKFYKPNRSSPPPPVPRQTPSPIENLSSEAAPETPKVPDKPAISDAPSPCKVFISYRRDDQVAAALLVSVYDRLAQRFGGENVFRDIDSIPLGVDFRNYISEKVAVCDVCVTLIGPHWNNILLERQNDPKDFVRLEIESALERGIPVIPLLIGDADVPSENELPESIKPLAWRNGMPLSMGRDFNSQIDRLIGELEILGNSN